MPFFDELTDRFKIENPNAMRRIITEKDGKCTNKTFVDVLDFFIEHKDSLINESIWSDIQDRSSGETIRKEDDVNHLDLEEFFTYLTKHYKVDNCGKDFEITDGDTIFIPFCTAGERSIKLGAIYWGYKYGDSENGYVAYTHHGIFPYVAHLNKKLDENFDLQDSGKWVVIINPKDSDKEVNNSYFLELLNFIIDNLDSKATVTPCIFRKTNESIWSDIQDRSSGETIRKEDERHKILERLLATYIKLFADSCYYHDEYTSGSYPDFRAYIKDFRDNPRIEEVCPDDSYFDDLLNYVNMETWDNQIDDTIMEMTDRIDKGEHLITDDVIEELRKHNVNESIWSDIQDRSSGEVIRKEDEMTQDDLDAVDDFIFGFATRVVWNCIGDSLTNFLKYIDENPEALDCDIDRVKKYVEDNWNKSICDDVETAIEQVEKEKKQDLNESIWSDIQDRSAGDVVRKEDDVNNLELDGFFEYIINHYKFDLNDPDLTDGGSTIAIPFFTTTIRGGWLYYTPDENGGVYVYDSIFSYVPKLYDKLKKNYDFVYDKPCFNYALINPKDSNRPIDNSYFLELLNFIIDNLDSKSTVTPCIFKKTNESIWSDIQDRSSGEVIRKEDKMTQDDFVVLIATARMFLVGVRNYSIPKNRKYAPIRIDGQKGFIDYILEKKKEHFWSDTPDEVYDKVIKFVKDNWGDCTGIQDFMDKYSSNINECDGVPGGLTPANVGGMGAAYFPGPNGEPGSGDLPSPTGIVYHQVAPFTMFLKDIKKKKKKKKFRIEDEPCAHSKNSKTYDYVDDFREYVDRTYNNMDRK